MNHQNLLSLYARNRTAAARRPLAVETSAEEATIYIYDMIVDSQAEADWFGGVAPETFVKALAAITAPTIHLRINSPGGSVFGARAIEQAIRGHQSTVIAHVDGYAASAASFLMLAADQVEIAPGGMVMIHKAWAFGYGNANDLVELAALLKKIDSTLVTTYVQRTKQSADQIAQWMAAETWFTAEEAVAAGFADSLAGDSADAKALGWDLTAYSRAPLTTRSPEPEPAPAPAHTSALEAQRISLRAIAKAAQAHGIAS
jgi:ATP-dependent Clp protease protease subunit